MKTTHYYLVFIMIISANTFTHAQIGVNTEAPIGVFQVDAKKNNSTNASDKYADDLVVTANGNVGIGTEAPQAKLDVRGNVRIAGSGNTPNTIYQLTATDNDGNAIWKAQELRKIRMGNNADAILNSNNSITYNHKMTGVSITLAPGSWQVYFTATYTNNLTNIPVNIWWDLHNSSTTAPVSTVHRVLSSLAQPKSGGRISYAPVNAVYFVKGLTVQTTFYIWSRSFSLLPSGSEDNQIKYAGEGKIWAIRIGE
jgi:hypothetical protein